MKLDLRYLQIVFVFLISLFFAILALRLFSFDDFHYVWMPLTDLIYGDYIRAHAIYSSFSTSELENVNFYPNIQIEYQNSFQGNYFARLLEYIFVKLFDNPIIAINFLLLISFPVVALATFYLFYCLKFKYEWNVILTLIFTFMPTHFLWLRYGFSTVNYSVIPIGILLLIFIYKNFRFKIKHIVFVTIVSIYISMSNLYYVQFFIFLIVFLIIKELFFSKILYINTIVRGYVYSISIIIIGVLIQFEIDKRVFGYSSGQISRSEDLPGIYAPFKTGGGYLWSTLISNPFGKIPIVSEINLSLNEFAHNFSQYFGCTFDKFYPSKTILVQLCYSDVEKYAYYPAIVTLFLFILIFKLIKLLRNRSLKVLDNQITFFLIILIFSIIYWMVGGIGNYVSLFFPFFRSFSRMMIVTSLLILIISYKLFLVNINKLNSYLIIFLITTFFFLDSILPSWNPILMRYTDSKIQNFRLELVDKNFNMTNCSLITYPVRPKTYDANYYERIYDVRLIHLLMSEYRLKISTGLLAPTDSVLNKQLVDLSQLQVDDFIITTRQKGFCGIIFLSKAKNDQKELALNKFVINYDTFTIDENVALLIFR